MTQFSLPLPLSAVRLTDALWKRENELVRREVIPYQWEALNDRVEGAAPSFFVHNMRAAARAAAARRAGRFVPRRAASGMVTQPDGQTPDPDTFYGWVFQDSDGYKWIEAVSYQLIQQPDEQLRQTAQQAVDLICAAQEADGYLDTFYSLTDISAAFSNLRDHHELYCFGHLAEAAVAWKEATGQTDLLDAACRFARCISRRFGPNLERGCPGHEIAEMALFRLYEATGDTAYRDLSCFFLDVRGTEPSTFALEENRRRAGEGLPPLPVTASRYAYHQADRPVRDTQEARGHAVRQMYLAAGMADEARLKDDRPMREACERLWRSVTREKMYVTGGVGATHLGEAFSLPYDLPSDTAYAETCAAIGLCFFARRMLQLNPVSEYADVMERALYNAVLSGMALDGKSFFYVNPLEADPLYCREDQRLSHVRPVRQKWFGCACCPPNIARFLSSLGAYAGTHTEDTLYFHLYIAQEMNVSLGGKELRLSLDADLTESGRVRLTVLSGAASGTLAFRLPGWADGYSLNTSFGACEPALKGGYLYLTRPWQKGDTLSFDFSMPIRLLMADSRVRELTGQVCFVRGPFVFCAESTDNGPGLHLLRVPADAETHAVPGRTEMAGLSLPSLQVPAFRVTPEEDGPLYPSAAQKERLSPVTLSLIPYFAWSNRGESEMRVWLPRTSPESSR